METATLLHTDKGQTVCLPDGYRLPGDTAGVVRRGSAIIIFPGEKPWQGFFDSWDKFTPDFMESREQPAQQDREAL